MKASIAAISAVAALLSSRPSTVHAAPGNVAQIVLGEGGSRSAVSNTRDYVHHLFEEYASGASASASAGNVVEKGASWVREHINDPRFTHVTHAAFPEYRLRLNKHDDEKKHTLCDPGVKQHSGYVDTPDDAHLFFWFFESRDNPKKDPVTLWLNGGPGCSSTTGLLFELGPCLIADNGTSTVFNPYSWNSNSNVIFLDSPRNVGLSYTNGKGVFTTPEAAADVYAFLNLWMKQYPEYNQGQDFNIAGESYAGTYIPQFASYIHEKQKGRKHSSVSPVEEHKDINLRNLLIGNGLTDPYYQFASVPDYACAPSEHAFVDESQCTTMRNKVSTCQRLETYCYDNPSRFTCVPAALYCWGMYSPMQATGRNLYDVRKTCNRDEDADGPLCYKELGWIESWLNRSEVKEELGAPKELKFASCDMKINQNFLMTGDSQHNSAAFLPPLIEDGIRVLVYAGNMDAMCNALGNERWFKALDNKYAKEIKNTKERIYQVKGKDAGRVISAGEGAGNFTFIEIFDAGHMVPTDQPVVALDMFNRFIKNERF